MYKLRSRFSKNGDIIFISHLDVMRVFERALRRANIPISYTKGFNPHPIMAFATALGLGVSSDAEYIDIQLDEKIELYDFIKQLNNALPKGLTIIESSYISSKEESLMSVIKRSVYLVNFKLKDAVSKEDIINELNKFKNLEDIPLEKEKKKKGKRKEKTIQIVNIRPNIYGIEVFSLEERNAIIKMDLAAGSVANLKPEIVISKINEHTRLDIELDTIRIHRIKLFKEVNGSFVTPLEELKTL
ncbi:TIGR03936 family radical SAM-associated protein [Alkaliphilus pronyensis]|nr:TIGR03936 family radical SAM-associated protein [Alkaliphilus pronyensis]